MSDPSTAPHFRSAPFVWAALGVCCGAWAGPLLAVSTVQAAWACLCLGVLAAAGVALNRSRLGAAALLAGTLVFGLGLASPPPDPHRSADVHLLGQVTTRTGHSAQVRSLQGVVVLEFSERVPERGTWLAAWARPSRPVAVLPGEFAHPRRHDLAGRPRLRVRRWIPLGSGPHRVANRRFESLSHGGLLHALASGDRSGVDPDTTALLTRTGTRHLLAISGLHVGLVASLVWGLAGVLLGPLRLAGQGMLAGLLAAGAAIGVAVCFAASVGWPVSTQRAVVMLAVAAAGRALHRDVTPANLLGLAAVVVVVVDPSQVRAPGFLMSFGAVAGMLTLTPWMLRWLPPDLPRPVVMLAGAAAATVGAQVGTLPVTAWVFQELAPLGVVSNLVAGPLLGLVALPGSLLGLWLPDGTQAEALAGVSLAIADRAVSLALGILDGLAVAPWTPAVGPVGATMLAVVLCTRRRPVVGGVLVALALGPPLRFTNGDLVVTFLAVGQGDAALVEFPDGRRWLIDGGPRSRAVLAWLRRRGIRRLDAVVLSHPHPDHGAGLQSIVEELAVGELWVPRPPEKGEQAFWLLWRTAFERGVATKGPEDRPGVGISVLHPGPGFEAPKRSRINEESLVLRIEHGNTSFLFAGDIEEAAEAALAPLLPPTDVVKVPHHGSRTSSSSALAAASQAVLAVVSCGRDSRFGHPHAEALAAWKEAALVRTDRDGTVEVRSDGSRLSLRAWTPERGWRRLPRSAWRPKTPD